jgi:hypothetical protein
MYDELVKSFQLKNSSWVEMGTTCYLILFEPCSPYRFQRRRRSMIASKHISGHWCEKVETEHSNSHTFVESSELLATTNLVSQFLLMLSTLADPEGDVFHVGWLPLAGKCSYYSLSDIALDVFHKSSRTFFQPTFRM